ncbi:hypothetical protein FQN54_001851 [Arachnomyces sp. PD_36]|nr:hypothetical protein FQN54_001851 [Arachnomyces sp. PD_36]
MESQTPQDMHQPDIPQMEIPPPNTPQPGNNYDTYHDIPAIRQAMIDSAPGPHQGEIFEAVDMILSWMFPADSGYWTRSEKFKEMNAITHEIFEFCTYEGSGDDRRVFLVTHCHHAVAEYESWNHARDILGARLGSQFGSRPEGQRTPLYGIVAMGRRVIFLRYDDESQDVELWRPVPGGLLSMDMLNNAGEVQEVLNYILAEH